MVGKGVHRCAKNAVPNSAFAHPTEGASEAGAISWCKSGPGKA